MSALEQVQSRLSRTAARRRWLRAWSGFWRGALVGALVYLAALGAFKLLPIPEWVCTAGWVVGAACALVGLIVGGWRRNSLADTARWVDVRQNLKERLSTALEVSSRNDSGEWRELVLADAAAHAPEIDPRRLVPLGLTRASKWALLVLVMAVGVGFVPEYRSKAFLQKQADAKIIRDVGQHLAGLAKQNLAQRNPALESTKQALERTENLGEQLTRAQLTRGEALRDIAGVTDKLKDQLQEQLKDPALRHLERAERTSGGQSDSQKQMDALKSQLGEKAAANPEAVEQMKRDLDKLAESAKALAGQQGEAADAARQQLAQSLNALAQQAAAMGLKLPNLDEAIAQLAANNPGLYVKDLDQAVNDLEKLSQMAKQLQQLQAQAMEQMGKDLAEQLQNGQAQAAQQTLEKMISQLKSSGISQEQLQKILSEVSKAIDPASPYGKVADYLKQAEKQMQQGDQPGAAQSLADAKKELDNLMEQFGDAQSLMAALDALKTASLCVGTSQSWGQCNKPGVGEGGRPGSGVGTWATDDSGDGSGEQTTRWDNSGFDRPDQDPRGVTDRGEGKLSDALKPTQSKGQFSPGAPMPSITLKGVSIKGASKLQYEEAVSAAQTEAQAALNQDKVPRAYQNAVRDYFDDLKK